MKTQFLIRVKGEREVFITRDTSLHSRAIGYLIPSVAFICPNCLDPWAFIWDTVSKCEIEPSSCEKCWKPDWRYPFPGSILDSLFFEAGVDWDLMDLLPEPLLRREFRIHLKKFGVNLDDQYTHVAEQRFKAFLDGYYNNRTAIEARVLSERGKPPPRR